MWWIQVKVINLHWSLLLNWHRSQGRKWRRRSSRRVGRSLKLWDAQVETAPSGGCLSCVVDSVFRHTHAHTHAHTHTVTACSPLAFPVMQQLREGRGRPNWLSSSTLKHTHTHARSHTHTHIYTHTAHTNTAQLSALLLHHSASNMHQII